MSRIDARKLEAIRAAAKVTSLKYFVNKEYLKHKITRKQVIDDLLAHVLPVKLSTKRICNNSDHCTPYDFFDAAMNGTYTTIMAWFENLHPFIDYVAQDDRKWRPGRYNIGSISRAGQKGI